MTNRDRRMVLGTVLSLALLLDPQVYGFAPGTGHPAITSDALAQITRQIEGQTLRFSERAIGQVIAGNVDADCGGDTPRPFCDCDVCDKDSARHFDSESFRSSTSRLLILKESIITKIIDSSPRGASARRDLGHALHAIQDYYSHSNWVNMGFQVFDARLGREAFDHTNEGSPPLAEPFVSETNPGTEVCPNNNPDVLGGDGLHFITTGFFDPENECAAPTGKCRHGGLACPLGGINKDVSVRPLFTEARNVAVQASIDFVNQILDDPRVAGNARAIKALMDAEAPTLAVVINTVISPVDEVKFELNNIVNEVRGTEDEPTRYVLVSLSSASETAPVVVDPTVVTANADEFLAALNALPSTPSHLSGFTYPLVQGLLRAIADSEADTALFLFSTDPSCLFPVDAGSAEGVMAQARAKSIRVYPLLFGPSVSCPGIMNPTLKQVAQQTRGQVAAAVGNDFAGVFSLVRAWLRRDAVQQLTASGAGAGTQEFLVPLAGGAGTATFSVMCGYSDTCGFSTLFRPSGVQVGPTDPGVTFTQLETGVLISVSSPEAGSWRLQVSPSTEFAAQALTQSDLRFNQFAFVTLTGRPGHEGLFPIQGQPAGGGPHTALASMLGPFDTGTFKLVSLEGLTLQTLDLTQGNPDAAADEFVGTFTPPTQPFQVVVSGLTTAGSLYERTYPGVFQVQPVEVTHSIDFDTVARGPTYPTKLYFTVRNLGPTTATFEVRGAANQGTVTFGCFKDKRPYTTVTLEPGASIVLRGDLALPWEAELDSEVMVSLTATNTADPNVSNSATATFTVTRGCESYTECYDNDGDGVAETCVVIMPSCAYFYCQQP